MPAKKTPPRRKPIKKAAAKRASARPANASGGDDLQEQIVEGRAEELKPKKSGGVSPLTFLQQVRAEAAKVTWTTRNETMISTVMVLIMVVIMAVFFFFVDQSLRFAVCNILPIDCVSRDAL